MTMIFSIHTFARKIKKTVSRNYVFDFMSAEDEISRPAIRKDKDFHVANVHHTLAFKLAIKTFWISATSALPFQLQVYSDYFNLC